MVIIEIKNEFPPTIFGFAKLCLYNSKLGEIGLEMDIMEIAQTIECYIRDEDKLCLVVKNEDDIVGILLANCGKYPCTNKVVANELFWGLHPKFQGKGIAEKLLDKFEKWAISKGAYMVISSVNRYTSSCPEKGDARLQNSGFNLFCKDFYKVV